MKRSVRIFVVVLLVLTVVVLTGALYQAIASARDRRLYPPPGRMVDIGSYRLHLYCTGAGSPTIVLNSASVDTVSDWIWLQPQIAPSTRVCSYDRGGVGWSDLGPEPHDPEQNSSQLHALLSKAGVSGPFIMVGHSFGGLYSRHYAARYPNEVVANVLIEATSPDFLRRAGKPEVMPNVDPRMVHAGPYAARLGILRLFQFVEPDHNLPDQQRAELKAFYSSNKFADIALSSFRDFPSTLAEVRATGDFGAKPLAIVVGSKSENASGQLFQLQLDLASLSSDHVVRIVDGADHTSLVRSDRDSRGTLAAIMEVLDAVRRNAPLQSQHSAQ
jgi:pimeloyl-ACP methyl ester carboxylesterase